MSYTLWSPLTNTTIWIPARFTSLAGDVIAHFCSCLLLDYSKGVLILNILL